MLRNRLYSELQYFLACAGLIPDCGTIPVITFELVYYDYDLANNRPIEWDPAELTAD